MTPKTKIALVGATVTAALAGGGAIAAASGGDDAGKAITGPALKQASAAALAHTGGGRVTGTEAGDEEGAYEVEVTRGGTSTDVHLDRAFHVLSAKADGDGRESGADK